MKNLMDHETINPLSEVITDSAYEYLLRNGLIDEKSIRDFRMKKKFKDLRARKISVSDSIESLRKEYPYLQFDTIRKIVYQ